MTAIIACLAIVAVGITVYKDNTNFDLSDGAHFFKKYYKNHEGSVHRLMEQH